MLEAVHVNALSRRLARSEMISLFGLLFDFRRGGNKKGTVLCILTSDVGMQLFVLDLSGINCF